MSLLWPATVGARPATVGFVVGFVVVVAFAVADGVIVAELSSIAFLSG